jgi:hypothetical protein
MGSKEDVMNDIRGQTASIEGWSPAYQEIQERAYKIYLEHDREMGHAGEHWLAAEEQLRREHGVSNIHMKATTIVVTPDGSAETTPERDAAIAKEEVAYALAEERLKEEREDRIPARSAAAAAGSQRH